MALFRRRRPADSSNADTTSATSEFWEAWPEVRTALADAVAKDQPAPSEVSDRVTALVRRIHPDLDWEVGPAPRSTGSAEELDLSPDVDPEKLLQQLAALDDPSQLTDGPEYAMTLRPGRSDEARVQSERWSRSAPEDDQWVFHPVRPADLDQLSGTVRWDDHELDLSHVLLSVRVNPGTSKIDVGVYHPDNMFLGEESRSRIAEHVTLLALGEDDYMLWIGRVSPLEEKPIDPITPANLPSVVKQMGDMLGGHDGWVRGTYKLPLVGGGEILLRHPLHRRSFPALTLATHVIVPFTNTDEDKQPTGGSEEALESLQSTLESLLGDNGALFGRRTDGGKRQFLYYLDPDSGVLPQFENALMDWPEGEIKLRTELDPGWRHITMFRKPFRNLFES